VTTTELRVCGYKMGTVYTGPRECGKPAKARTNSPSTTNGLLCGIHVRSTQSRGPVGTTITWLAVAVKAGQVWQSNDPREAPGRKVRVWAADDDYVQVRSADSTGGWNGRASRIKRSAFGTAGPNGYRLVEES
jgi:hypothetical protein